MGDELSHIDAQGRAAMVDVGSKDPSQREARARARVRLPAACHAVLANGGDTAKGNVLHTARLAGIMAAKRTHELIPLCHQLVLNGVDVDCELGPEVLEIRTAARCCGRTGVEMEALTAASVAALTVYDMLKAVSHDLVIESIELIHKSGGRSGVINRDGVASEGQA